MTQFKMKVVSLLWVLYNSKSWIPNYSNLRNCYWRPQINRWISYRYRKCRSAVNNVFLYAIYSRYSLYSSYIYHSQGHVNLQWVHWNHSHLLHFLVCGALQRLGVFWTSSFIHHIYASGLDVINKKYIFYQKL